MPSPLPLTPWLPAAPSARLEALLLGVLKEFLVSSGDGRLSHLLNGAVTWADGTARLKAAADQVKEVGPVQSGAQFLATGFGRLFGAGSKTS